jgi:hypothetical protein
MTTASSSSPYYRPSLIAGIAASVGVMVGSVGPWVTALIITVNGLDAGNWGVAALTLGAVSCIALLIELFWPRTPFHPRWAVPLAWAVVVAGVACLTFALPFLIRIMTSAKANFFGLSIGPGVGWGLWLLAFASAVLCVCASIVATQLAKSSQLPQIAARSDTSWTSGWRWVAVIASLVVAIANVVYASLNWNGSGGGEALPTPTPSIPGSLLFPKNPTTPETTTSTTTTAAIKPKPRLQPGPHSLIADVDLPEGTVPCATYDCGELPHRDTHSEYWRYSASYDDTVAFLRDQFATGRRYDARGATWWKGLPPCYDTKHQSPPWGWTVGPWTEWTWSDGATWLEVMVYPPGSIAPFGVIGMDQDYDPAIMATSTCFRG